MYKIYEHKKTILVFTLVSVLISWSELLWIRQIGSRAYGFEKWKFALFMLPWMVATAGFLLLIYINWFKPGLPNSKIRNILFMIFSVSALFVWGGIWAIFVF